MKKKVAPITIESLPKSIEYGEDIYSLEMHITAWNKICLCYHILFEKDLKKEWNIFSQVVEPKVIKKVEMNDFIMPTNIVDVPDFNYAVELLKARIDKAIENKVIKIYKA